MASAPPAPVGPTSLADLQKGATVPGDCGSDPLKLPDWLDMARCDRVHGFFAEHAFSLVFTWHCALCIGFSLPSLLCALVFTGASGDPEKSLKRYARTAAHLFAWHIGNIWDPASDAHASVQGVRHLHASVRAAMTDKMPSGTWISSYDLACVQTGFMGASTVVPKKYGINADDAHLADYVYFWRCVGYQLGISDTFNLCGQGKDTAANIIWEIIDQVLIPDFQHPPTDYMKMATAYIDGLNLLTLKVPIWSLKSTNAITLWALGKQAPKLQGWDRVRYFYFRLILLLLGCIWPFRALLNWAIIRSVGKVRDAVARAGDEADGRCPFTGATFASGGGCPMGQAFAARAPAPPRAPEKRSPLVSQMAAAARHPFGLILLLPALLLLLATLAAAVLAAPHLAHAAPCLGRFVAHRLTRPLAFLR